MRRVFAGRGRYLGVLLVLLLTLQLLPGPAAAAPDDSPALTPDALQAEAVPDQVLVAFEPNANEAARDAVVSRRGGRTLEKLDSVHVRVVQLPPGRAVADEARGFKQERGVRYAEPNYLYQPTADPVVPNDSNFGQLWGLENTGQTIRGQAGTADADIDAPAAWATTTGSRDIVVGVVDTGVDYTHPDLAANMWSAPEGWSLNDCAAGTHGYRKVGASATCDPQDENGHGTHVSGTIGAVGNNSVGVVGVNWNVSIMALRFFPASGGATSDAITVIDYAVKAKQAGVNLRVLNNSWGCLACYSQALLDEITVASDNGILFVASAGNDANNNDATPSYPAGYAAPNIIAVAATDNTDALASFSNYGAASVHLGAPGVNIASTYPNNRYVWLSGTSMASPHVAGAAALVLSAPGLGTLSVADLKNRLIVCGDSVSSLAGKSASGKRLNVNAAIAGCTMPTYTLTLPASTNGSVAAAPVQDSYAAGARVTLTATADARYAFDTWTINGDAPRGRRNPLTLTMYRNYTVAANFTTVLHNQLDNQGGSGATAQAFESGLASNSSLAADDFVVPAGQTWEVSGIDVIGVARARQGVTPAQPTSFNVVFYKDAAGLPGDPVSSATAAAYTRPELDRYKITLPTVVLGPGNYWVSVQANLNYGAAQNRWYWYDRTVTTNTSAAWRNPGGGFDTACTSTWGRRTDCNGGVDQPDQVFWLRGTSNQAPTIAGATVARQQGSAGTAGQIATVTDAETPAGNLTVTATPPAGITVGAIANGNGAITATVAAACTATIGENVVPLTVADDVQTTSGSFTVDVAANTPPALAYSSPQTVPTGSSLTVSPASGPSDNGAVSTIQVASPAGFTGAVSKNSAGEITFDNARPAGTYTVTVTATDNCGVTTDATFTLQVNSQPVANADSATTAEDTPVTVAVLANDLDGDGNGLTVSGVTQPANGAVAINPDKTVTYTPAPNFNGTDTFTYTIGDGNGDTSTATVTVTVSAVNDPPTAANDSATVAEDSGATSIDVLANDSGAPDTGETLTITAVTQGANGAVAITGGGTGLTYAPAPNFSGMDSFNYTVSDGNGGSATATVTITVTPVNDAPTAAADSATVAEDSGATSIDVLANDRDADGNPLAVTAVTQPASGSAAFTATGVTYTPAANFFGTDSFSYTIGDGQGGSATATVTVSVTPVNDAPTLAVPGPQAVPSATDLALTGVAVADVDAGGDPLGVTLTAANGTLTLAGTAGLTFGAGDGDRDAAMTFSGPLGAVNAALATLTYRGAGGYSGPETITLTVDDLGHSGAGGALTTTKTIAVSVGAPAVALAPSSLAFGPQQVGTTSAAQTVTLTNGGTAPLAISNIATSGDFAKTGATTCGASLAAGASCAIALTFTPAAAGARSGALTIADNAAGSPHTVALSGTGTAAPSGGGGGGGGGGGAYALTLAVAGGGSATGGGAYAPGSVATLVATPNAGQIFTGWAVDGQVAGWADLLTLTMDGDHSVVASFVPRPSFPDVPTGQPYDEAIAQLAARGIIRGYANGRFGPEDTTLRAQMAALIARAMGWDAEDHGNTFPDRGSVDADLWRNVGTLAFYNVARGYPDGTYRPTSPVLYAQAISFIARAMEARGYWEPQPDDPRLYPNVPASSGHRADIATYVAYVGGIPGAGPTGQAWGAWGAPSTRGWHAEVLWRALDSYWGVDRTP